MKKEERKQKGEGRELKEEEVTGGEMRRGKSKRKEMTVRRDI